MNMLFLKHLKENSYNNMKIFFEIYTIKVYAYFTNLGGIIYEK